MSAQGDNAISICQQILSNGSRNAEVFHKLASALHQTGKSAQAKTLLQRAISIHPGNNELKTLSNLLISDVSEQARLEESAKKNQGSLQKAEFKLNCLTKTGRVGINACKEYLSLSNIDGDQIRTRLTKLENSFEKPTPSTELVATTPETTPPRTDESIITLPDPVNNDQVLNNQRRVAEIQRLLNEFGFNAGSADGISGAKTRNALTEFYARSGAPERTTFDDLTLSDLREQQIQLDRATQLFAESRRADTGGDSSLALDKLDEALRTSGLLQIPSNYRKNLQISQAQTDTQTSTQTTSQSSTQANNQTSTQNDTQIDAGSLEPAQAPTDQSTVEIATISPTQSEPLKPTAQSPTQDLNQLLAQIKLLEDKLVLQETSIDRQLQFMRSTTRDMFR